MSQKVLNTKLLHRIGTTAEWISASSQVLANGEIGFERTTSGDIKFKIGDGQKAWAQLSYVSTSNTESSDEVCISSSSAPTESQYKIWINTGVADDQQALESSEVYYIDFSLTIQNNEETISTNDSYASIYTEYGANSIIIARLHNGTDTLFAPLLEYIDSENTFYFGAPSNNEFKIITLNSNDECELSTMALGGGGAAAFEVGDNMLLEDGILKAKYGEQVEAFGKIFKQNIDGSDMPDGLEREDPITVEESNCIVLQSYDTTEDNSILPIITSGNIELQINYDDVEDTDNNIKFNDMVQYDTESAPVPFYWSGNETGMKYFVSVMLEDPDESLLNAWAEEESKWFIAQIDLNPAGLPAVETVIGLPLDYFTNENEEEIVSIQLNAMTTTSYKLPVTALNVGAGLKIDENTNKISLSFGEYKRTEFEGIFSPGNSETTPSTKALGNLYCWYSNGERFINWEENSYPEPFSHRSGIINSFYSKGSKSFNSKLNINTPQNYQNTLTDEYYTIPFYFDKPINILTNAPNSYKIELKEMQYQDNILYTTASMALDSQSPTSNIFYAATVNTNDSINTIMNNGSINPIDDKEPAILFVLLDQPSANQVFIWAFSNINTLGIDSDDGKVFIQGEEYPIYTQLPPNWLNAPTCIGPSDSIVLGEYCEGSEDTKHKHQLILGKYNNPSEGAYFQIGNGDKNNKTNIFEVDNDRVSINGNLRLNGTNITIKPILQNPGTANSIDTTAQLADIAQAYNDLANKYNNLISYLQNAGYMYN